MDSTYYPLRVLCVDNNNTTLSKGTVYPARETGGFYYLFVARARRETGGYFTERFLDITELELCQKYNIIFNHTTT